MEESGGVSQEVLVKQEPGVKNPLEPAQHLDLMFSENNMVKIKLEDKIELPVCAEDIKCEIQEVEITFVKAEPTCDSGDSYSEADNVVRPKHLSSSVTHGLGASNQSGAKQKPVRKRTRGGKLQSARSHESPSKMPTSNQPRAANHEVGLRKTGDNYNCSYGKIVQQKNYLYRHQSANNHGATDLRQDTDTQDPNVYNCDTCGKTFQQKSYLIRHQSAENHGATGLRRDTDTQDTDDFNCDTCGRTFPLKSDLIRHIRKAAVECSPLKKMNSENLPSKNQAQNSDVYVSKGHARNKAFWCDICDKQFRDSSDIKRHKRTHTGDKPYECEVCKKQFAQASVLTRHKRIHTNEKPYSCDMCDKQFRASCDLTKHRRIHFGQKPVTCDICKKQLMGSDALTKHRRIHTGGKPHACQTCGKHFARTGDLVIHTRIHTGDKPYSCEICKKRFARSYKLKEHTRIHTTPNPPRERKKPAT